MRKILLTICLTAVYGILAFSQTLVVTTPQHRNVVIEEFTGIHCGYCPDGHVRAQAIADANPNRVVLINVHAGGYAVPSTGEPDFRTTFGDNLANYLAVDGYPSGAINRHLFPEIGTSISMGRGSWAYASNQIFPNPSPVNAGFISTFDPVSRELTVKVELFYTSSSPASTNYIQVALLENHVYGYQSDYTNGTQTNYDHKHILRHFVTGQWGDPVTSTTQGSFIEKTYTYSVPATWNIANCDIAVYVSESQAEVYTGVQAIADGGSNNGATAIYLGSMPEPLANVSNAEPGTAAQFSTTVSSFLAGTEDFMFTLEHNAPSEWISGFTINGTNFTSTGTVSLTNGVAADITISAEPQTTPGLAKYHLKMESLTYPTAPARFFDVYVIYGITTVVAEGSGSWGNGEEYDFSTQYDSGLTLAGSVYTGHTSAQIVQKGLSSGAFTEVKNLFMNIGWRFPSMSDEEATAIMAFLDAGGNLFVAGQDIGWDINDANGYGTAVTQDLYANYLHASFSNDGTTANNSLNANTNDTIFGTCTTSPVADIFAGNMYPDQIIPTGTALPIFYYGTGTTKIAAIRFTNGSYKVVYLGLDLAMISNEETRNQILDKSYDWFTAPTIGFENPETGSFSLFPCPANAYFTIRPNSLISEPVYTEVFDALGNQVYAEMSNYANDIVIDTESWNKGLYLVRITKSGESIRKHITIIK